MTADRIIQTLKQAMAEEPSLNLSQEQISDDVPLMEGGLDLDSIGILEVISLVETTFPIQFQDEDLRIATFETPRSLAEVILKRMDN